MGRKKKTTFQWDREEAEREAAIERARAQSTERVDEEEEDDYDRPSRSQLKREDNKYKKCVKELIALRPEHRNQLPLSDGLREALEEVHRLKAKGGVRGAMRRQVRRVSTLLREDDYEAIQAAMLKR